MIYCIDPKCERRENSAAAEICAGCGSPLQIQERYQLVRPLRPLDAPGNAQVFEVKDLRCSPLAGDRYKVLKASRRSSLTMVKLLQQEAKTLKALRHAGLPPIEPDDGYFAIELPRRKKPIHCLVMQKVPGENLQVQVERQGPAKPEQVFAWLLQLLAVLDYLHQRRYFHQDIKPSNIMLRPDGQLVLIDFGTVYEVSYTVIDRLLGRDVDGMGIFSPGYTAPEQMMGRTVPQSDLYALGRTAVFLLTGRHPITLEVDSTTGALLWRDEAPAAPESLVRWIDYLMAPAFWQRPPNVAFVLEHLGPGLAMPPVKSAPTDPPPQRWLKLLNVALFLALLITTTLWIQRYWAVQQRIPENDAIRVD
ncbi:MAG: serine/threonine protein kinase [Elainellaceae cyanobacterium]